MKSLKLLIYLLIILFISLFLIRFFSEKQLDDVNPQISCNKELMKKADIYYIIPLLNNESITNNPKWCEEIKIKNKKLALHGVNHNYHEFETDKTQEYLEKGINIFKECFDQKPEIFKPPQLKISKNNKNLIKKNNIKLDLFFNQLFHKVYHCNNTGLFPNKLIDIF